MPAAGKFCNMSRKRTTLLLSVSVFIWTLNTGFCLSNKQCVKFEFPNAKDGVLAGKEHEMVNFPFHFVNNCRGLVDFEILVSKLEDRQRFQFSTVCKILVNDGKCATSGTDSLCKCTWDEGKNKIMLSKLLSRTDSTEWIWTTSGDWALAGRITFNVTYPPSVYRFNIQGQDALTQPVDQNSSVDIFCKWNNGNPPTQVKLLDRRGLEMDPSGVTNDTLRYIFPAVACKDAGIIGCEAPGASLNKSVILLVNCPPEFDNVVGKSFKVLSGQNVLLPFRLRTHTTEYEECWLSKLPSAAFTNTTRTNCSSKLSGTPPDLQLTLKLDNVTKEMEGLWQLELSNHVGSGSINFSVIVIEMAPLFDNMNRKTFDLVSGQQAEVAFPVKSHTTELTRCRFSKDRNFSPGLTEVKLSSYAEDCRSFVALSGTPPNLTLTVHLWHVTKEEEGNWRIELTNHVGSGHVDFLLSVLESHPVFLNMDHKETFSVLDGKGLDMVFPVRTHTTHFQECSMTKRFPTSSEPGAQSNVSSTTIDCASFSVLSGTPPNLTLTVRLDNVTEEMNSAWQITLTNHLGSGHTDFNIRVKSPPKFLEGHGRQFSVTSGQDVYLSFRVSTHKTEIVSCGVTHRGHDTNPATNTSRPDCCACALAGTPPIMILTVLLKNVTGEIDGQWQLGLTTPDGDEYIDFSLKVIANETKSENTLFGVLFGWNVSDTVAASIILAISLIVIAFVIGIVCCARRCCHKDMRFQPVAPELEDVHEYYSLRRLGHYARAARSAVASRISGIYDVIMDK